MDETRCHYHGNENGKLLSVSNLHLMCVIEWQSEFLRRGAITERRVLCVFEITPGGRFYRHSLMTVGRVDYYVCGGL